MKKNIAIIVLGFLLFVAIAYILINKQFEKRDQAIRALATQVSTHYQALVRVNVLPKPIVPQQQPTQESEKKEEPKKEEK